MERRAVPRRSRYRELIKFVIMSVPVHAPLISRLTSQPRTCEKSEQSTPAIDNWHLHRRATHHHITPRTPSTTIISSIHGNCLFSLCDNDVISSAPEAHAAEDFDDNSYRLAPDKRL